MPGAKSTNRALPARFYPVGVRGVCVTISRAEIKYFITFFHVMKKSRCYGHPTFSTEHNDRPTQRVNNVALEYNDEDCRLNGLIDFRRTVVQYFDQWSARRGFTGSSLARLTSHGINGDFKTVHFVLHAQPLSDERHTAENLNPRFEEMLENWNIDKTKVHMVLRDGGTNIVKALGLSDLQSANCSAHQINLNVEEALKAQQSIKSSPETCRKISGHFNHSYPVPKKLEEIQKPLDNNKQSLRIIRLSANKLSIADVLYIGHLLKKRFEKDSSGREFGIGTMKDVIRNGIINRFSSLETNQYYATATLLHPPYKSKYFERINTEKHIVQKLEQFCAKNIPECLELGQKKKKRAVESSEKLTLKDLEMAKESSESESENAGNFGSLQKELEAYKSMKKPSSDDCELQWWKTNKNTFPLLSKAAKLFLSPPSTRAILAPKILIYMYGTNSLQHVGECLGNILGLYW
uniref:HAT C-terminal dimerisation domain-containing protein n=1 Tax=Romanomermis culicivorax TaxID=13658 RepID=A0A915KP10_ROMCU